VYTEDEKQQDQQVLAAAVGKATAQLAEWLMVLHSLSLTVVLLRCRHWVLVDRLQTLSLTHTVHTNSHLFNTESLNKLAYSFNIALSTFSHTRSQILNYPLLSKRQLM